MKTCINCGTQITCGCQERTATDGKKVCSNCVTLYEQQLFQIKASTNTLLNENSPS